MKNTFCNYPKVSDSIGNDKVPEGTFEGGDEIPAGTFHGGDEIPAGTFHGLMK